MKSKKSLLNFAFGFLGITTITAIVSAATTPPESAALLDTTKDDQEFKSEGATAALAGENGARVVQVSFPAGKGWPAFNFPMPAGGWDLSKYTGVQVDVTNTGAAAVNVALRVDNAGDWKKNPWNTESMQIAPGATKTLKVTFGKSYGGNPGYALDPSKVVAIKMFADNPKQDSTVEVKNLKAFGTATPTATIPSTPAASSTANTKAGSLFDFSKADAGAFQTQGNATVQIVEAGGAKVVEGTFPAGGGWPAFDFPAPAGGWNLSGLTGVQAELTNTGTTKIRVALRVDNPGDWKKNPWNTEAISLAPGETKTIKVTFGKSYGGNPGYPLDPAKVSNLKIFADNPKEGGTVQVKSLQSFGSGAAPASSGSTPSTTVPSTSASTAGAVTGVIFDIPKADAAAFKTQGNTTVQVVEEGGAKVVQAQFPAGNGYPTFDFPPPAGGWNLSTSAGVQVDVTNKGTTKLNVALRVDNAGDWQKQPWNTESVWVGPGETKTIKVAFGKSYGGNPGYALDSSKVSALKVFAVNPKDGGTIQVKNLATFGAGSPRSSSTSTGATPKPASASPAGTIAPAIDGALLKFEDKNLDGYKTNQSEVAWDTADGAPALKLTFNTGDQSYPNVQLPIPAGNWNLSAFGTLEAEVFNPGTQTVRLFMRADNPGNWKDQPWNTQITPLPAGQTKTIKLVFGENNGAPGYPLDPARISGIQFFLEKPKAPTTVLLKSLRAAGSPQAGSSPLSSPADKDKPVAVPDWSGKRPPVEGNWVQTLNENFDGPTLNEKVWRTTTWWNGLLPGQTQRYSKDNLIFENGVLRMKTEKRRGHQNDDPALPEMDYTTGHIITYDKWTQLYGYFEARVKLPTARGLWPAFWMMPDRGPAAGPEGWKRENTKNGGMEIDILEHLTEWGPGRNNVAAHWDGYDKDHQAWGTANVYYGPTPDSWHTFGLLWEPGKLTWFIDGIKKAEFANERVGSVPAYLLLNVQMGGWATKDVDLAKLPDYYQIDWVRAWQLKDRIKP